VPAGGRAAYAAEADGKLTGRPGVAMVTRGPGAANAMIGVHAAWQDGTPLVLFVGLVPMGSRQRESFQDFDIRGWFGTTTKRVLVLDEPGRASELVAEAFFAARSGRPGPVVVGLPEDVIREPFHGTHVTPLPVAQGAVDAADLRELQALLSSARQPLVVTGGNAWSATGAAAMTAWLERTGIPAITQWRANGVVPSDSPVFAGTLGYRRGDTVAAALDEADLVLAVGTVLGEIDTDGYTLRQRPDARTVIVSTDPARTGHSGPVTRHILARPDVFAAALSELDVQPGPGWAAWRDRLRTAQERYTALPAAPHPAESAGSPASMTAVMRELVAHLPRDAIITGGAGNHSAWPQRYLPIRSYPALLSPRNGSMGYSIPAALAAGLRYPHRLVVTVTGDGEFMMNGNELATARQHGAAPLIVVMDNGQFGTIPGAPGEVVSRTGQRHPARQPGLRRTRRGHGSVVGANRARRPGRRRRQGRASRGAGRTASRAATRSRRSGRAPHRTGTFRRPGADTRVLVAPDKFKGRLRRVGATTRATRVVSAPNVWALCEQNINRVIGFPR
jgi:acetolactate synthase-1/2/3 large subunit